MDLPVSEGRATVGARQVAEYRKAEERQLRVFRIEAVRAEFRQAWQEKDYAAIVAMAGKIPDSVLQEDPKLLMWFDQALVRAGDG